MPHTLAVSCFLYDCALLRLDPPLEPMLGLVIWKCYVCKSRLKRTAKPVSRGPQDQKTLSLTDVQSLETLWPVMREEAQRKAMEEPILGSYFHATILNHKTFGDALSFRLASKLDNPMLPTMLIRDVIAEAADANNDILSAAAIDIIANYTRDPACRDLSSAFLLLKGYHALQAHRIAHWLWNQERHTLAQFFQNQISVTLGVDIHPAACIGSGIMFDHATGIVVGETAVIEDDVSVLHSVTLGGTGKSSGDRHPKIRRCPAFGRLQNYRQYRNWRERKSRRWQRGTR